MKIYEKNEAKMASFNSCSINNIAQNSFSVKAPQAGSLKSRVYLYFKAIFNGRSLAFRRDDVAEVLGVSPLAFSKALYNLRLDGLLVAAYSRELNLWTVHCVKEADNAE